MKAVKLKNIQSIMNFKIKKNWVKILKFCLLMFISALNPILFEAVFGSTALINFQYN